jgi:hypothetical protein
VTNNLAAAVLRFATDEWQALPGGVRNGDFDHLSSDPNG